MSATPLEGLMSVSVSRQPAAGPQRSAAPPCTHRHRRGSRRQPRKPVHGVRGSCFSSGTSSGSSSGPSSGPACGSAVHTRALRNQHSPENAARERSRVRNLRQAFHSLQAALPSVPPDTKLSKLDVLVLATNYIAYLTETLDQGGGLAELAVPSRPGGFLHPVKKWPMRSLLYCGSVGDLLSGSAANQTPPPGGPDRTHPPKPPFTPSEADTE